MTLRKSGVTSKICFRKGGLYPDRGVSLRKGGQGSNPGGNYEGYSRLDSFIIIFSLII